jgi:hypothetical protein
MILEIQKLYYGNSALLNKLKYYRLLIAYYLCCFSWSIILPQHKNSDPKQTLGGMAKETAHQIGTPLSSL